MHPRYEHRRAPVGRAARRSLRRPYERVDDLDLLLARLRRAARRPTAGASSLDSSARRGERSETKPSVPLTVTGGLMALFAVLAKKAPVGITAEEFARLLA